MPALQTSPGTSSAGLTIMQMIPFQCMRCWRRLLMGATPRRRRQLAWRHPWYQGVCQSKK